MKCKKLILTFLCFFALSCPASSFNRKNGSHKLFSELKNYSAFELINLLSPKSIFQSENILEKLFPSQLKPSEIDIPLPAKPKILKEKLDNWVESETDENIRDLKRKMSDYLINKGHIDFDQFANTMLSKTVKDLNKFIKEKIMGPYCVIFDSIPHKSKRWVYQLAKEQLDIKPESQNYYINRRNEDGFRLGKNVLYEMMNKGINTFVIFDDASFTGEQLKGLIEALKADYEEIIYNFEMNFPMKPTFIIAAPYLSNKAKNKLENLILPDAEILISEHDNIPLMDEILNQDELFLLKENLNSFLLNNENEDTKSIHFLPEASLTFFDHKIPDEWSFGYPFRVFINHGESPYKQKSLPYYQIEAKIYDLFYNISQTNSFLVLMEKWGGLIKSFKISNLMDKLRMSLNSRTFFLKKAYAKAA